MRRERELEDLIGCQALNEAGPAGRGSFYERLGLSPAGTAPPRPESGSRQACRKTTACKHARQKTQYDAAIAQDRA